MGVAAVAGAGAAAAAGTAAAAGGTAATVLGGVSTAAAVTVGAVAVVAAAVVGATQVLGPGDAGPLPGVSGTSLATSLAPSAGPTGDVLPVPPPVPSVSPTDLPGDLAEPAVPEEPGLADGSAGGDATGPGRAGGRASGSVLAGSDPEAPVPDPSAGPPPDPAAPGQPGPGPVPPDPTPPPEPAPVVVVEPGGGLALVAGSGGQQIALTVRNDGGRAAVDLRADVALPPGVRVEAVGGVLVAGRGATPLVTDGWVCLSSGEHAATCTLPELPPGASAPLVLRVSVDDSVAGGEHQVGLHISGRYRTWSPPPLRVSVAPSPARLVPAAAPAPVQLVVGRTRTLALPLVNAGGAAVTAGAPATVDLVLPPGVTADAAAPWTCAPEDRLVRCRLPELAGRQATTLVLALTAAPGVAPREGAVEAVLGPVPSGPPPRVTVPSTLVRPAAPVLAAPAAVDVALGAVTQVPVDVTNTGDLPATGVAVRLAAPGGAVPVAGGSCRPEGASAVCRLGEPVPAGATVRVLVPLTGGAGAVGDLGVAALAVAADDADLPAPTAVGVRGVAPVLALGEATAVADGAGGGVLAFVVSAAGPAQGRPAADADDLVARVTLPRGAPHDPAAVLPGTAACTADPSGRTVECRLGRLAAGGRVPVQVNVRVAGALDRPAEVVVTAAGAGAVRTAVRVVASSAGLTPVWSGTGDLDVTEVGAPLLVCRRGAAVPCPSVHQSHANNGLDMQPLDQAPPPGARARVPVSSETRLALPAGRPVVWAGLYWSGVRGPHDGWSGDPAAARLRAPDGTWTDVHADPAAVRQVRDDAGRHYYQAAVDVTALVAGGGGGAWALADAAVSDGRSDRDPTYYAGWSLVVVHGAEGPDGASVTVHEGPSWVGRAVAAPAFAFVGEAGARARVGVVTWEGDRGTGGDRLTMSGVGPLTPLRWDGTRVVGGGSATDAFDSTATGWRWANSLGVDAKAFADVTMASDVATLTPTTGSDQYLLGVVTVRTAAPVGVVAP